MRFVLAWLRRSLWEAKDILAALRGPDFDQDFYAANLVKQRTTVHIRREAFPKLAASCVSGDFRNSARSRWDLVTSVPYDAKVKRSFTSAHFFTHLRNAALVLGLK